MTDARFFIIIGLLLLSAAVFGAIGGWCLREERGDD